MRRLDRYTARNEDSVPVAPPHSGPSRAERGERDRATSQRAPRGYQGGGARWLASLWRNVARRGRVERELDEELRAAVSWLVEEKIRAGMNRDEAVRAARLELGGVESVKERVRDVRAGVWLERIWRDLVVGLRVQMKTPVSTLALVLVLSLGIAATSVSFTLTNTLFLRPLPVTSPAELVRLYASHSAGLTQYFTVSYPDFLDMRALRRVFSGVAVEYPQPYSLGPAGRGERIWGELVGGGYFQVLGVALPQGRPFSEAEENQHSRTEPVAVISHGFWKRRLGGRALLPDEQILLNGRPVRVVGVAPERFRGMTPGLLPEVWIPAGLAQQLYVDPMPNWLQHRAGRGFFAVGRLQPGVTAAQADAEVARISRELQRTYPDSNQGVRFTAVPEADSRVHPTFERQVLGVSITSLAVAALVLLVTCANVAGVLLVRASMRRKEIGVRLALGATRRRVFLQLLTEHLCLSLMAGVLGLTFAYLVTSGLSAFRLPLRMPLGLDLAVDARILGFSALLTTVTGIAFGLVPALEAARLDPLVMVRTGETSDAPAQTRARSTLVVVQVALSVVLLIVGGLFLRNLQEAEKIDIGFEPDGVVIASVNLTMQGYNGERARAFWPRLVERIRAVPGADAVSVASHVPFELDILVTGLAPVGYRPRADESWPATEFAVADRDYFSTMRIPMVSGREFDERDRAGSTPVVIVNDVLARRFWPDGRAVGRQLATRNGETYEIVGVARRGKYLLLGEDPKPFVYFPMAHADVREMTIVVRGRGGAARLLDGIASAVAAIDPALALFNAKPMTQHLTLALAPARSGAGSLTVVGVIALALTSLGLYGTIALVVSRRMHEIGIRRALGAADGDVVWLVVRGATTLVYLGVAGGVAMAMATTRLLQDVLYGVSAFDPLVFVAAPLVLFVVCSVAAWIPARRAVHVSAASALRYQ